MRKSQQPLGHYSTVNAYGAAESDNSLELILSMMRGTQDCIAAARGHMERKQVKEKGEQLGKAIALVDGLRGSLNMDAGGEIAGNLDALYEYMGRRMVEANAQNSTAALDEVSALLGEIRDAWEQVIKQTASSGAAVATSPA